MEGGLLKTLLVMRHAKSDWNAEFGVDHDRPLNRRGVASARQMGRLITELRLVPDLVISSTAVRARSTAQLAMKAGKWDSRLQLEPGFYGSGSTSVIMLAAALGGAADRMMIVGHQPTWGMVIHDLTGDSIEVKTATLVVIELPIDVWPQLPDATGTVTAVHHPGRRA
ncbi:MAG: histidine phosphatase family protein [Acidimicrobiia bacterium]